jgi:membrane protein
VARPQAVPQAEQADDGRFVERVRAVGGELVDGFKENDLLTYASAISFQILTALIPFALFVLAIAGLLHASDVWRDHLEPGIRANVSPDVFGVINGAVTKVFTGQRVLWATLGGGLALWQVSGAIRAVMGALAGIYAAPAERPFIRRYSISFVLSIEVGGCFVLVGLCLLFAPFFFTAHHGFVPVVAGWLIRWTLVIGLLLLIVVTLVRHAPARPQKMPWVSLGAGIVIGLWVLVSLGFYLYLTDLASYESVFGSLAAVIVAMAYLYMSTTVFLFGAQLDAIIRAQATGCPVGGEPED